MIVEWSLNDLQVVAEWCVQGIELIEQIQRVESSSSSLVTKSLYNFAYYAKLTENKSSDLCRIDIL